jgi:hypothetical protein
VGDDYLLEHHRYEATADVQIGTLYAFMHPWIPRTTEWMAEMPDGTTVLRRVRTGYRTKEEYDGLEYTLYHLAGAAHFGGGFVVEALHLTDEKMEAVAITTRKLDNRRDAADEMLAGIAAGAFPPKLDAVTCPRCPHFFICPATPIGPLTLS